MTHQELFARIVKALPRKKAEEILGEHRRPWQMDRKTLDRALIAADSETLRDEIIEYITRTLRGTL